MNVTKDVIADLLPLYEAGEARADTRALVEAYLKEYPGTVTSASVDAMLKSEPASLPERERRAALERTRSLLKSRTAFFALALGCNLMTFSFAFGGDGITWFMWRDAPGLAGIVTAVSIGFWIAYLRVSNQLRVSGM